VKVLVDYVEGHRDQFGVEPICRVLSEHGCAIAPSTYYAARSRPVSARARRDAVLVPILVALWMANYRVYGARKLWKAAGRAGHDLGRDQVARLMRAAGIEGVRRGPKVRTTRPDPSAGRHPDLVRRDFTASRPNQLWVTDLERHEALLNLAVVKGHRHSSVAADGFEAEGSLIPGTRGRVDSSSDNAGTGQYCQMVRVRQARRAARCAMLSKRITAVRHYVRWLSVPSRAR
jgi:hypothetical protein